MPKKEYKQSSEHIQNRAMALLKKAKEINLENEETHYPVFLVRDDKEEDNFQGFIHNGKRIIGHKLK